MRRYCRSKDRRATRNSNQLPRLGVGWSSGLGGLPGLWMGSFVRHGWSSRNAHGYDLAFPGATLALAAGFPDAARPDGCAGMGTWRGRYAARIYTCSPLLLPSPWSQPVSSTLVIRRSSCRHNGTFYIHQVIADSAVHLGETQAYDGHSQGLCQMRDGCL